MYCKTIIISLVSLLFISSCNKDDHRDKYIGEWYFKVKISEVNTDSIGYFFDTTYYYLGNIDYATSDNEIEINYSNNSSVSLEVDQNGELSNFPTHYCYGSFVRLDSIYIDFYWGGQGGGTSHIIAGNKQ